MADHASRRASLAPLIEAANTREKHDIERARKANVKGPAPPATNFQGLLRHVKTPVSRKKFQQQGSFHVPSDSGTNGVNTMAATNNSTNFGSNNTANNVVNPNANIDPSLLAVGESRMNGENAVPFSFSFSKFGMPAQAVAANQENKLESRPSDEGNLNGGNSDGFSNPFNNLGTPDHTVNSLKRPSFGTAAIKPQLSNPVSTDAQTSASSTLGTSIQRPASQSSVSAPSIFSSFGQQQDSQSTALSSFASGSQKQDQPVGSSIFGSFGQQQNTQPSSSFTFGSTSQPQNNPSSSSFTFGSASQQQNTQPSSSFTFGASRQQNAQASTPSIFGSFGQQQNTQSAALSNPNTFGQQHTRQSSAPPSFNSFDQSSDRQSSVPPSFGSFAQQQDQRPPPQSSFPTFGQQQTQQPPTQPSFPAFGQPKNNPFANVGSFGQQQNGQASAPSIFGGFGQQQNIQASAPSTFSGFGQQQNSQTSAPSVFSAFGQQPKPQAPASSAFGSFGQQQSGQPSSLSESSALGQGTSAFTFGLQPQSQQQNIQGSTVANIDEDIEMTRSPPISPPRAGTMVDQPSISSILQSDPPANPFTSAPNSFFARPSLANAPVLSNSSVQFEMPSTEPPQEKSQFKSFGFPIKGAADGMQSTNPSGNADFEIEDDAQTNVSAAENPFAHFSKQQNDRTENTPSTANALSIFGASNPMSGASSVPSSDTIVAPPNATENPFANILKQQSSAAETRPANLFAHLLGQNANTTSATSMTTDGALSPTKTATAAPTSFTTPSKFSFQPITSSTPASNIRQPSKSQISAEAPHQAANPFAHLAATTPSNAEASSDSGSNSSAFNAFSQAAKGGESAQTGHIPQSASASSMFGTPPATAPAVAAAVRPAVGNLSSLSEEQTEAYRGHLELRALNSSFRRLINSVESTLDWSNLMGAYVQARNSIKVTFQAANLGLEPKRKAAPGQTATVSKRPRNESPGDGLYTSPIKSQTSMSTSSLSQKRKADRDEPLNTPKRSRGDGATDTSETSPFKSQTSNTLQNIVGQPTPTQKTLATPPTAPPTAAPFSFGRPATTPTANSANMFKLPASGGGTSSGSSSNFFAQFGKLAEKSAAEEKAKRKAEDFDSDEDDEAEWERKDEEEQAKKKAKWESTAKKGVFMPGKGFVLEDGQQSNGQPDSTENSDAEAAAPAVHEPSSFSMFGQQATKLASSESVLDTTESEAANSVKSNTGKSLFDRVEFPAKKADEPQMNESNSNPFAAINGEDSHTSPTTDHTWSPNRAIRFSSSMAPTLNVTPASPSTPNGASVVASNVASNSDKAESRPNPFGTPKPSSTPSLFANLFQATPATSSTALQALPDSQNNSDRTPGIPSSLGTYLQAFSPATSRASSPGVPPSLPDSSIESGAETGAENGADDGEIEQHEQADLTGLSNEEKRAEDVLFEAAKARCYKYVDKQWESQGTGVFRVLKNKESGAARILLRASPSGRIIINSRLLQKGRYEIMKNVNARFTVVGKDGSVEMWFAKFQKAELAAEFVSICEANKRA